MYPQIWHKATTLSGRSLRIDEETGTDFWRMAIEKEMKNVMPAFEFHDNDKIPVGYAKI
jgi:hypothetical protein